MTRRPVAATVATVVGWALALGWLTWPLAAGLGTHLPHTSWICDFDLRQMIWALSWQSHALTTAPSRFYEANIYHPTPHALLYADAGFGALPYFLPTFLATGNPVLASNLMFLGSLVLTATLLHLVVARWTGLASAGLVAAAVFVTTRWVLWIWIPAAPNYAVLQALPVIIFLAADLDLSRGRRWLLGVLLVLHGMTTPYHAASTLVPLAVLAGLRLLSARRRRAGARLAGTVAVATVCLAGIYAPYGWIRSIEPNLRYQTWWGYVRDVTMTLPYDLLFHPVRPTSVPIPFLLLIMIGLLSRCLPHPTRPPEEAIAWRQGLLWTIVGLLLSLTPTVRVMDHVIRLPQAELVDRFPGLDLLRDPYRMGIAALFGLAILAGAAFAEVHRRIERLCHIPDAHLLRALTASALVVFASGALAESPRLNIELWPRPYPLMAAAVPHSAIMARLREPGGPVLQLPIDPEAPFGEQLAAQGLAVFESIGHWRPLLNGYGGFFPATFVERMRLAARLPDAAALAALRRETGVEMVFVRGDLPTLPARERWDELANRGGGDGLRLVVREGSDFLFAVE
jgi:hypothetical protein